MDTAKTMIRENIGLLNQGAALISELSDKLYADGNVLPYQSGVGMHIRHILDFYKAFLGARDGCIDYEDRERSPEVETDRAAAGGVIKAIAGALEAVEGPDREVLTKNDSCCGRGREEAFSRSTVGRELQFLFSHTVHHYAMIAMILTQQGVTPPGDFGVAPSTLSYRREAGL